MKITKSDLLNLIENLLLEDDPDTDLTIDMSSYSKDVFGKEFKEEGVSAELKKTLDFINKENLITDAFKTAREYFSGSKYNPKKILQKKNKDVTEEQVQEFKNFIVKNLDDVYNNNKAFVASTIEKGKELGLIKSGGMESYAMLVRIVGGEYKIFLFIDSFHKKRNKLDNDSEFKKFVIHVLEHEFMHIENFIVDDEYDLTEDIEKFLVTKEKLDTPFYADRYSGFEKIQILAALNNDFNTDDIGGVDEVRARIAHYKSKGILDKALEDGSKMTFKELKDEYNDTDAAWLFLIDYQNFDNLAELSKEMKLIAKSNTQGVQKFYG
jgi:hypothetical protein